MADSTSIFAKLAYQITLPLEPGGLPNAKTRIKRINRFIYSRLLSIATVLVG
jgi:hypothetical protein